VLFQEGDRGFSFYVVLDGAVEIVEQSRGTSREVTVHEPGEFTGDVDTLSGRASLVTGRATAPGEVLELTAAALLVALGRHAAAAIVAPPIRNRRRDGEDRADDAASGSCGVASLMVDIAASRTNRRWWPM